MVIPMLLLPGCSAEEKDNGKMWSRWLARRSAEETSAEETVDTLYDDNITIPEGVDIDGVEIGGLNADEARIRLKEHYEAEEGFDISLKWDGSLAGTMNSKELGLTADVETALRQALSVARTGNVLRQYRSLQDVSNGKLHIEAPRHFEGSVVESFVKNIDAENKVEPVDSKITLQNGKFSVSDSAEGYGADIEATVSAVKRAALLAMDDISVDTVMETRQPHFTKEALSKVHDVLGTYSTHYGGNSWTREQNVMLATSRLGGLTLMPGDQASANILMKERTEENGYKLGKIYVNGSVENGIGGGVCQVASTLYNALLLSEIQVDERHNHSMVVSYIKPGRDATISEDYKDLKFTNNLDSPIYIFSDSDGVNVTFTVYGEETRPSNRKVSYPVTVVYELENPGGTPEMEVYLEKVVTVDGVEESRKKLHSDYYEASAPQTTG
jgi:vancomycin resistance protein YoaR